MGGNTTIRGMRIHECRNLCMTEMSALGLGMRLSLVGQHFFPKNNVKRTLIYLLSDKSAIHTTTRNLLPSLWQEHHDQPHVSQMRLLNRGLPVQYIEILLAKTLYS